MDINYRIENDLDWNNAEFIDIKPEGWKQVRVRYIDSMPMLFWRLNDIEKNFNSKSELVAKKGVYDFFTDTLTALKIVVLQSIEKMPEDRRRFYEENILELFDE